MKTVIYIRKNFVFASLFLLILGCKRSQTSDHKGQMFVQVEAIQNADKSWGYQISADHKVVIKQEFVPVVPQKMGFKTKEDALKTGQQVIQNLKKKNSPILDSADLEHLGVYPH